MLKKFLYLIFIYSILFSYGCAWRNTKPITSYVEFGNKIYVSTLTGNIHIYDPYLNKLNRIDKISSGEVFELISSGKYLILYKKHADNKIYFLNHRKKINYLNEIQLPKTDKYLLITSADERYIYAYNKISFGPTGNRIERYKIDLISKVKFNNHFDSFPRISVVNIYEDENYIWYACFDDRGAHGETVDRGNPVVVRRNKATAQLDKIRLGDTAYEGSIAIFGDDKEIWVSCRPTKPGSADNVFKISKDNLTYTSFHTQSQIACLVDGFLWSNAIRNNIYIYDKEILDMTRIEIPISVGKESQLINIGKYIYAFSSHKYPSIIKISTTDKSCKIINLDTTLNEGMSNFSSSIERNISGCILYSFYLPLMMIFGPM